MFFETVLDEINSTLEQLIKNAEILVQADSSELSEFEIEAFQKTQESLIHHWMRMDQKLSTDNKQMSTYQQKKLTTHQIAKKAERFKLLEPQVIATIKQPLQKNSMLIKRKHKRLFRLS